jgi:predicted N-formylglutamate amidohydrolase
VLHLAVHSFVPRLHGVTRAADVGLLYDPRHSDERALCTRWQAELRGRVPRLRVRRNYPYRGDADGLTTQLRRRLGARYRGVELEVNQALLLGSASARARLAAALAESLEGLLQSHLG